jgi:hypothetical protein
VLLYEEKEIIKIFYEKENDLIIHEWLDYNPEDQDKTILMILEKIYELFLAYPVKKVIVKTDITRGMFSPHINKYIKEVQFPRLLADTEIRYIATVKSKEEMKGIASLLWQEQFDKEAEILLRDMGSEKEARDWLKTAV